MIKIEAGEIAFLPPSSSKIIIYGMSDWKKDLTLEFERAAQARIQKNEGQMRVCARRAAGIAGRSPERA